MSIFSGKQKITPCLWFDTQAEEAANFYISVFAAAGGSSGGKNGKIKHITHYGEAASKMSNLPVGSVLTVTFELEGQEFMGLNGGPVFKLSEAVSFMISCKDQKELDYFWNRLTEGGEEGPCGWLKDKFGMSWQVVPEDMEKWMKDQAGHERVMVELLKMKKIDLETLKRAYEGKD